MKNLKVLAIGFMVLSFQVGAQETSKPENVEGIVKEAKKSDRKKKVEMCHDCGKPESQCDCPHEVKEKEAKAKLAQ